MGRTGVRMAVLAGLLLGVAAFGQQPAGTKPATDKKDEQKSAAGGLVDTRLAITGRAGTVLGVLGRSEPADRSRRDVERKDVIIEELIFVGLTI